ncbi:MAG: hypothetical protein D6698_00250 [Gammaproteobacteria bacterium]|nr:MAG: hypothetical protein D6698_00250 [Gammaproteobacteria bacterium]
MMRTKYLVILLGCLLSWQATLFAEVVTATDEPKIFRIGVTKKDETHPFYGKGAQMGFTVDGEQGKPIVLTRGVTYKFDVETNVKHDFYFSTSPAGWGAGTVTDGIKGQFTYRGTVRVTPSDKTPDIIYYGCRNHKFMGGKVYIANKGDKINVVKEKPDPSLVKKKTEITERQVRNRLMYADMILKMSKSDPAMIDQAKMLLQRAREQLRKDQREEAMTSARVAIALLKGKKVERKASDSEQKKHYEVALENLKRFEASYLKQSEKLKKNGGLDQKKFDQLKQDAKDLERQEKFDEATKKLTEARQMLTLALSEMLKGKAITDEREFSDPKVSFKYDLDRYKGYEELIPVGIEMKKPSPAMEKMMRMQVDKSRRTLEEAKRRANNGNYNDANILVNQAIGEIRRALRLIGVR